MIPGNVVAGVAGSYLEDQGIGGMPINQISDWVNGGPDLQCLLISAK